MYVIRFSTQNIINAALINKILRVYGANVALRETRREIFHLANACEGKRGAGNRPVRRLLHSRETRRKRERKRRTSAEKPKTAAETKRKTRPLSVSDLSAIAFASRWSEARDAIGDTALVGQRRPASESLPLRVDGSGRAVLAELSQRLRRICKPKPISAGATGGQCASGKVGASPSPPSVSSAFAIPLFESQRCRPRRPSRNCRTFPDRIFLGS